MPFVYFHRSDGKHVHHDENGRYMISDKQVQAETKRILARYLVEGDITSETIGLSIEARDLSGRTLFQVSVVGSTW
jgi:hypothetical protein